MPTLLSDGEGHTWHCVIASDVAVPLQSLDPVHAWKCFVGTWEIQAVGNGVPLAVNGASHTTAGQAVWKSDEVVVVMKRANKIEQSVAESVERRT